MRKIWLKGLDFDEDIPEHLEIEFKKCLAEVKELRNISVGILRMCE